MHSAISHPINSTLCLASRRLGVFGLAKAATFLIDRVHQKRNASANTRKPWAPRG